MQLHCRSCGKPIPAQDVNIELGIAKCLACNAVFNFLDEVKPGPGVRPRVGLPKRFTVENWGPELVITRRWFSHKVWFLMFFCTFWDGFLVMWYSMAFRELFAGKMGGMIWVMILFPLLHVAAGVGLTYFAASLLVNRTTIRVAVGQLTVRHSPLPWPGNCQLFTTDIKQLFCIETHTRGHHYNVSYSVMALKQDDTRVSLVNTLEELDQAVFIEQQVELHLKIPDQRVPGEVLF
jgi:hypothetical protein